LRRSCKFDAAELPDDEEEAPEYLQTTKRDEFQMHARCMPLLGEKGIALHEQNATRRIQVWELVIQRGPAVHTWILHSKQLFSSLMTILECHHLSPNRESVGH
jgi:hypothetical protein